MRTIHINTRNRAENIYIVGNGGSASIASHAVVDFINVAKLNAHTLHDSATLTCMANDYGYENSFSSILKTILKENDILIAISSSGKSKSIINAVNVSKKNGTKVITLSGFNPQNELRTLGCVNFWCNSSDYGMVEISHQFILHNIFIYIHPPYHVRVHTYIYIIIHMYISIYIYNIFIYV